MNLKIAIGSDHGGFRLKEEIKDYLRQQGVEHTDFGTYSTASVDYPDIAQTVGEKVAAGEFERGILICGTGIGISIAANKVPGVRAALCGDVFSARMSREHNNANILALGERVIGSGLALMIVQTWLEAEFAGGRHARRVEVLQLVSRRGYTGGGAYGGGHRRTGGSGDAGTHCPRGIATRFLDCNWLQYQRGNWLYDWYGWLASSGAGAADRTAPSGRAGKDGISHSVL